MKKLEYRIKEINDRFYIQKNVESFEWKYPNLLCKYLKLFGRRVQVGRDYKDLGVLGQVSIIGHPYNSLEDAIKQIEVWDREEAKPIYHYL